MSRASIPDVPFHFEAELRRALGVPPGSVRLSGDPLERAAVAADASHYLLTPQLLLRAINPAEVSTAMRLAGRHRVPLTFRSGGTSLSGQALSDGLLVDVRRHFRDVQVLDDGLRVRVQPGATVRQVNAKLARHGRRLGPDPASEIACTMGGVLANNSSGMTCGTVANSYRTLESMVLVLPSGTVVDTGTEDADDRLRRDEPALHQLLRDLRDQCRQPHNATEIRRQFAHKNTMGYGLNALLDHDRPVDILAHLVVGSEGTLAFVAEATLRTLPNPTHLATALLHFPALGGATELLEQVVATGAQVTELLDAASLRVCRADAVGAVLPPTAGPDEAALLVEYQAADADELAMRTRNAVPLLRELGGELTSDSRHRAALWQLRKGLYTKVAGARPTGTTALLEDVAVPLPALAPVCTGLQEMFAQHGYPESVIFGHAKDGNIHFLVNEDFHHERGLQRYEAFTEQMVELVLAHGGSLKAEHGTGRIMAPYVERQYGPELFGVMRAIKQACDPQQVLNPGSVLTPQQTTRDDEAALLKLTPTVEASVDGCVECGYCEPVCPSADLTLTPRQRIVVRRAIAQARLDGDEELAARLERDQSYPVVQTCAVDGMCATSCPLGINTGALVRELRSLAAPQWQQDAWQAAARAWGPVTTAASAAMTLTRHLPEQAVNLPLDGVRSVAGDDLVPRLSAELPRGGARRRPTPRPESPDAVYLPACVNTMFGAAESLERAVLAVALRAGVQLWVPDGVTGLCCGTPWKSKGMVQGQRTISERTMAVLSQASEDGRLTVVCDATSCTEGLAEAAQLVGVDLRLMDATTFVAQQVLPRLPEVSKVDRAVLHPTCSSTRLGCNDDVSALARHLAREVVVPDAWRCCAFAGDRGLLHPELTASATAPEADEVSSVAADLYLSANRTCELGMTRATGHEYQHVLLALAAALAATDGGPQRLPSLHAHE